MLKKERPGKCLGCSDTGDEFSTYLDTRLLGCVFSRSMDRRVTPDARVSGLWQIVNDRSLHKRPSIVSTITLPCRAIELIQLKYEGMVCRAN